MRPKPISPTALTLVICSSPHLVHSLKEINLPLKVSSPDISSLQKFHGFPSISANKMTPDWRSSKSDMGLVGFLEWPDSLLKVWIFSIHFRKRKSSKLFGQNGRQAPHHRDPDHGDVGHHCRRRALHRHRLPCPAPHLHCWPGVPSGSKHDRDGRALRRRGEGRHVPRRHRAAPVLWLQRRRREGLRGLPGELPQRRAVPAAARLQAQLPRAVRGLLAGKGANLPNLQDKGLREGGGDRYRVFCEFFLKSINSSR